MTKNKQYRQKGVALLLALILLFVITAIAFGVIVMSNTENAINTNYKGEEAVYFAARAGVEEARYRLLSGAVDQNGSSITLAAPTATPDEGGAQVLYILGCKVQDPTTGACQTAITLADITTPGPYFDDELCHDIPGGAGGLTQLAPNVPCANMLPTSLLTSTASVSPYPLDYKWVRVMIKENYSVAPYPVVSASPKNYPVCFDKTANPPQEIATQHTSDCALNGAAPGARPVYMVTALAVSSNQKTRRLVQEEISLGVVYYPKAAIYDTSTACPALVFTGNGMTGSFSSVAGNTSDPPPGASTTTGADVITNGGINMGAGNPTIAGNAYETNGNPPTCFTAGKNLQPPSATYLAPNMVPPPTVYPAPNPPPPTTNTNYSKNTTLTPANSYGNISASGGATITLQVPAGEGTASSPATFVLNSLSLAGQSTVAIAPANSSACGGTTTCYVKIVIAGNGISTPLDLSGGSLTNPSGVPATVVFDVAQPTACSAAPCGTVNLSGGTNTYCIVNAPMDNMNITGNGDIFGSLTAYQTTDKGNGTVWFDKNLGGTYSPDTYLSMLSFRELSY